MYGVLLWHTPPPLNVGMSIQVPLHGPRSWAMDFRIASGGSDNDGRYYSFKPPNALSEQPRIHVAARYF